VLLWAITVGVIALVAIPSIYLLLWSLMGTEVVGRLDLHRASFRWFGAVLSSPDWLAAMSRSVLLGAFASVAGALLNGAYNYSKHFTSLGYRRTTNLAMTVLLLNPLICYALSMSNVRAVIRNVILNLPAGISNLAPFLDTMRVDVWFTLLMGHLAIITPLQFLLFEAADRGMPPSMLWAARTLGAGHVRSFRAVYVPCMRGTFIASVIVGFFASFDEIVLALFMLDDGMATIPLKVYRSISQVVQPHAAVTSAIVMVAAGTTWFLYSRTRPSPRFDVHSLRERLEGLPREVLAFALTTVTIFMLVGGHGDIPLVFHGMVAVLSGLAAGTIVGLLRLHNILKLLLISVNVETVFRGLARAFVLEGVTHDVRLIKAVEAGGFTEMTQDRMQRLARTAFGEFPHGRYVGTDRHVPSRFQELYPNYLHDQMLSRSKRGDIRFVLYGAREFEDDRAAHPAAARSFVSMHTAAGVTLLSVPWSAAIEISKKLELETPDLGVFEGRAAVFFDPPTTGREKWRVMLDNVEGHRLTQLRNYFYELVDHAQEIVRGGEDATFFRDLDDDDRHKLKSYILA
jgi:ABC-type spermidine/putrescine transport system permease subunit II